MRPTHRVRVTLIAGKLLPSCLDNRSKVFYTAPDACRNIRHKSCNKPEERSGAGLNQASDYDLRCHELGKQAKHSRPFDNVRGKLYIEIHPIGITA